MAKLTIDIKESTKRAIDKFADKNVLSVKMIVINALEDYIGQALTEMEWPKLTKTNKKEVK